MCDYLLYVIKVLLYSLIFAFLYRIIILQWGADLSYIPFSQPSPLKREPVALKVQWHAGNTYVLPEQKGPSPPTLLRESITRTSLSGTERRECTSNWDSTVC